MSTESSLELGTKTVNNTYMQSLVCVCVVVGLETKTYSNFYLRAEVSSKSMFSIVQEVPDLNGLLLKKRGGGNN